MKRTIFDEDHDTFREAAGPSRSDPAAKPRETWPPMGSAARYGLELGKQGSWDSSPRGVRAARRRRPALLADLGRGLCRLAFSYPSCVGSTPTAIAPISGRSVH